MDKGFRFMSLGPIFKVLGKLLMFFSITMLTPIIVDWIYHEHNTFTFLCAFVTTLGSGLMLFLAGFRSKQKLTIKDGFILVLIIWSVIGLYGGIPYMYSSKLHLTFSDAVFESISGLTTTGATTIHGLDNLPRSLIYYRQQSQLLGGMGTIILSVAILPMLGVGEMQLYRDENNGLWKENKLTPKIADTAKILWTIYFGLVLMCILSYHAAGMNWFNAINFSFSTISTGGFSPTDSSMIGQPHAVYSVCIVFMIISATSFVLHFNALHKISIREYWYDSEFKAYIFFIFMVSIIVILTLISHNIKLNSYDAFWEGLFQVASLSSNTGLISSSSSSYEWSTFLPILLTIVGLIGGCAGSTAGGIKIIRALLIKKQAFLEIKRLIHPMGIFPAKLGSKVISGSVVSTVWGFLAAYFILFIMLWIILVGVGVPLTKAFLAMVGCISNLGSYPQTIGINYTLFPTAAHWILNLAMLIGRLEVFTVMILFTSEFWKQ